MPLDPSECASSTATGFVCKYYALKAIATASINMHSDYYSGLNVGLPFFIIYRALLFLVLH